MNFEPPRDEAVYQVMLIAGGARRDTATLRRRFWKGYSEDPELYQAAAGVYLLAHTEGAGVPDCMLRG